jgi:CMP/dCMP kinase
MKILKDNLQIAIDGPVAAGKGTISKLLANKLGILYVDTGAMYRALTYFVKQNQISWQDETGICQLLQRQKPTVILETPKDEKKDGRLITIILNDKDISWKIRTEEISHGVSVISNYKCVRDYMVPQQQNLASSTSVVMEGRDITTRVLPKADLKIYMDASEEIRVKRRWQQMLEKGETVELENILKQLHDRDFRDMNRDIDPLQKTLDAWVLDSTNLSVMQTIEAIINKLKDEKLIA